MSNFIKINGVEMPQPSSFTCTIMDISSDGTSRDANGTMHIDRICTKRKIELEWKYLNMQDMSKILKLVRNIFFTVTYPDPMEGHTITKTFYVGDRTTGMYSCVDGEPKWKDIKYNLIER